MITLDDALTLGQGIERPFCCPSHDDTNASASVNVLKGVWYCYACRASGVVGDKKKVPSAQQLMTMLEPEQTARHYPESWLALFADPGYWETRFPAWLCFNMGLGEDPFTGDAIFPVRTAGFLAGVGRRLADPGDGPRYKYPAHWSASHSLFGYEQPNTSRVIVLVEGAADASACWGVGARTFGCYGAGVHAPQWELIRRANPKWVLTGFDMDEAGDRATVSAFEYLENLCPSAQVEWPAKDPADCTQDQRAEALIKAAISVGAADYLGIDADTGVVDEWNSTCMGLGFAYNEHLKEVA